MYGDAYWECPNCVLTELEPHPRYFIWRCANCKEHLIGVSEWSRLLEHGYIDAHWKN